MGEKRYIISDASKKVDVESHVLRYWEEELEIDVPRNEMGHRYYTDFHIQLLKNVKELKEQGFQLKAIKMLLPELMLNESVNVDKMFLLKEELNHRIEDLDMLSGVKDEDFEFDGIEGSMKSAVPGSKMEQFQLILGNIVAQALKDNNNELGKEVSERVSDSVIKEMDYLLRVQDEREEERFKRIDEVIRNYQRGRQEIAYSAERRKKPSKFFKKNKRN